MGIKYLINNVLKGKKNVLALLVNFLHNLENNKSSVVAFITIKLTYFELADYI